MIHPDKIGMEAKKREDENYKFRSFLKGHADEEELHMMFVYAPGIVVDHWAKEQSGEIK